VGHNTDTTGIEKTLGRFELELRGKSCLLWGAGGSAKAVAFVLAKLGAKKVFVYNRGERGEKLAQDFSLKNPQTEFKAISSLDEIHHDLLTLMINSTPLGMHGQESGESYFKQIESLSFEKKALAFDLIYNPEETTFLKASSLRGLQTVSGLGMLIDQALATWEIWVGPLTKEESLHRELKTYLKGHLKLRQDPRPLILCGFMGVGKTTVGTKISQLTGRTFIDTDLVIESTVQQSIAEIFSERGESEFRKLESKAILEVMQSSQSIVSLGGGALKNEDNLTALKESGTLIYLEADAKTLEQRITTQGLKRPLLENLSSSERAEKISHLLSERKATYERAHLRVDTRGLTDSEVAYHVISQIGDLS
jgi:shikimate dehydrogenase